MAVDAKTYLLQCVEDDLRIDGRARADYRPMEIETGIVAHSFGSSRLKLANTDVLVSVKIEVDVPHPETPHEGKIEFFIDCSANATPNFEGRGGENLATEISNCLASAYKSNSAFDYTKLCIMPYKQCWKLYLDILLLECGGNLYDAISIAVKAALWNTKVPHVKSASLDGKNIDLDVSEKLNECEKLDVSGAPLMVTLCRIGEHYVVDPTSEEEECSQGAVVVAVSKGNFTTVLQTRGGSLHPLTLLERIQFGKDIASRLDSTLMETLLSTDENSEEVGFLK